MENKPKNAEFLVVPYPLQGHVAPMMKLSECIASHGINVTVVITEHNYKGMLTRSMIDGSDEEVLRRRVTLVTVPDGLEPEDDRKDIVKVAASLSRVMPEHVYKVIIAKNNNNNNNNDDNSNKGRFTCLIADKVFGPWGSKVAEDAGINLALFFTSAPGILAITLKIPDLIQSGFMDEDGNPLKKDGEIQVLPEIPTMKATELPWYNHKGGGFGFEKNEMFKTFCSSNVEVITKAKWVLCNWFHELTPSATSTIPNVIPIGPLLANTHHSETLYPEDLTSLIWLDQQPVKSVIYVAFGSISTLPQSQLNELAHGLELSGRRFLWVVRTDLARDSEVELPDGFEERVASCGKLVKWASQEKVLGHPSIACFVTHCGWNSTLEGLSNGVPLICWPCFADQPYTRTCVCDVWKVGLSLVSQEDQNKIISANEVRSKIDELLSRDDLIANSLKIKATIQLCISEGGSSFSNMKDFIAQAQQL